MRLEDLRLIVEASYSTPLAPPGTPGNQGGWWLPSWTSPYGGYNNPNVPPWLYDPLHPFNTNPGAIPENWRMGRTIYDTPFGPMHHYWWIDPFGDGPIPVWPPPPFDPDNPDTWRYHPAIPNDWTPPPGFDPNNPDTWNLPDGGGQDVDSPDKKPTRFTPNRYNPDAPGGGGGIKPARVRPRPNLPGPL